MDLSKILAKRNTANETQSQVEQSPQYEDVFSTNKDKNFIQRIVNPDKYPSIKNQDGTYSTHKMGSAEVDGKYIAFPMIVQMKDGKMHEFENSRDAIKYALQNNEYVSFKSQEEANSFSENGYKKGTNLEKILQKREPNLGLPELNKTPASLFNPTQRTPISQLMKTEPIDFILNSEARRDKNGNLMVYEPPKNDGGIMEVAGITLKDHPEMFKKLKNVAPEEREGLVKQYLSDYTAPASQWAGDSKPIELLLRDTYFHRGPTGSQRIAQIALGEKVTGKLTDEQIATLQSMPKDKVIDAITKARETYENEFVGRRANLAKGLSNRFQNARKAALELL